MRLTQGDHRALQLQCIAAVFPLDNIGIFIFCNIFTYYMLKEDSLREKTKAIHCGCIPFQLSQIVLAGGQTQTGLHISYYTYIFNIHYTYIEV